jgi:hypothetical protein
MYKIIVLILLFISFSCKTEKDMNDVEMKITQIIQELLNGSQKSCKIIDVLNSGDVNLADGYAFLAVVEINEIYKFFTENKNKPETLLNDPEEHFKTLISEHPTLSQKFESDKCKYFAHSIKLKKSSRSACLFICINLNNRLVIFDYGEY